MKHLHIQASSSGIEWDKIPFNTIDENNWASFSYSPKVAFKITHHLQTLYIRFYVVENYPVRAQETEDQAPVYQDSCVEFFFLDSDSNYLNFEANAKGALLAAKGKDRQNRKALKNEFLNRIERLTSNITTKNDKYNWQLTLGIPFDILGVATGKSYNANFYKCGDLTQAKHYLSWNPILCEKPDFHRPEFFGKITFE